MEQQETNEFRQLLISGVLGDGHLIKASGAMSFACIHEEYLLYKKTLGGVKTSEVRGKLNHGYKKDGYIYTLATGVSDFGKYLLTSPLKDMVEWIDELGLAMWFYDDISQHQKDRFYNINTHSFSLEDQENILIPLLNKFNIFPKIMPERKKDGRVFNYLYVGRYDGAYEITKILKQLPLECYKYKVWPDNYIEAYEQVVSTYIPCGVRDMYKKTVLINKKFKELEETLK